MSHYHITVLEYLRNYQPNEYAALKQAGELPAAIEARTEQLYAEADQVTARLRAAHPDMSELQLQMEAEAAAIAALLPFPTEEPINM